METIKAYLAGIIDGEGTITLSHLKSGAEYRYPCVTVASTTFELLEFCKRHYGGQLIKKKVYQEHHTQSGTWGLRGALCIPFLQDILPFLVIQEKRRRAQLIIDDYQRLTLRNGRYSEEQKVAKLEFEREFFHPSTP